jgi:Tetratricopeptide Repeats-Sensor
MPPQPICFAIMPYGTKATQQGESSAAPARINFDRLWQAAIRPAIEALGYSPVRADEDLGALIIQEMIERLAISDLVIADVSIPNGNVYYEVGIRHAAKQQGCVMIAADWSTTLFDINQMRQIRYPLATQDVDDDGAAAIQRVLKEGIPKLAEGQSPFYTALPGYPDQVDEGHNTAFRKTLLDLSRFQGEVLATRAAPAGERRKRAIELRERSYAEGPIRKSVALELLYLLRDCTDWPTTQQFVDELPADVRGLPVVQEQKALAQSRSGDQAGAIATLEGLIWTSGETSERCGLLGGRYKALYYASTDPRDKAQYLDRAIRQYDRGMRLDLNDYYPASNLPLLYLLRGRKGDADRARIAGAIAMVGCERSVARNASDPWAKPTLLAAAFAAGDVARAQELGEQIESEGPAAWQLATTIEDLRRAVGLHDGERAAELTQALTALEALL